MATKKPSRSGDPCAEHSRRWLPEFLKSSGGAAVVSVGSVLLAGLLGTGLIQYWDGRHQAFHDKQQESVVKVYSLVEQCRNASEGLIDLTGPNFDPRAYPGIGEQRKSMKETFNACVKRWQEERGVLALSLIRYHFDQPELIAAWEGVDESASAFMNCATRWHLAHAEPTGVAEFACAEEKATLKRQTRRLTGMVGVAHHCWWDKFVSGWTPVTASSVIR